MFENFWHKKEMPLLGLIGLGGGAASTLMGGAGPISASGGNIDGATPGNGYVYHIFTASGAFTVNSGAGDVEYVVVGGGAGGGYQAGGGGGSGGGVSGTMPVTPGPITVTIGSGGTGRKCGGDGIIRVFRLLTTAEVTMLSERRETAPYGLQGGTAGKIGKNTLIRSDQKISLGGKFSLVARPNDIFQIETPGGGGHGKPDELNS